MTRQAKFVRGKPSKTKSAMSRNQILVKDFGKSFPGSFASRARLELGWIISTQRNLSLSFWLRIGGELNTVFFEICFRNSIRLKFVVHCEQIAILNVDLSCHRLENRFITGPNLLRQTWKQVYNRSQLVTTLAGQGAPEHRVPRFYSW